MRFIALLRSEKRQATENKLPYYKRPPHKLNIQEIVEYKKEVLISSFIGQDDSPFRTILFRQNTDA